MATLVGMRCAPILTAMLALAIAGRVGAAPSLSTGSHLYRSCAVCHQASAWGSTDGIIPSLAGQQERYLERQLALFRSGARVDTAMQVVTAHPKFGDHNDIVALARYLSGLDPNPNPVKGSGAHLRVGQETYTHICAACHGPTGHGEAGNRVPRIAGQHYPYLREQIESAARLHKDLAPPEMTSALRSMSSQQKDALADYISRLGVGDTLDAPPEGPQPPSSH